MDVFTVRVDHTDRSRTPDGRFVTFHSFVDVGADSDSDAQLVAAQLVGSLRADIDGMVLGTTVVDVRI